MGGRWRKGLGGAGRVCVRVRGVWVGGGRVCGCVGCREGGGVKCVRFYAPPKYILSD